MKRGCLKEKKGLVTAIGSLILLIPLISAFDFYGSPMDYLNNEWVKFAIIFALLFFGIYTFFNNRMNNPVTATIVGGGLSLLITIPIMRRGILDDFLQPEIVDWIVIIALLIGLIFLFYKFGLRKDETGRRRFSLVRLIIFVILLLILASIIEDMLPDTLRYGVIGDVIEWIKGLTLGALIIGLIILGIILFVLWKVGKVGGPGRRAYVEERAKVRAQQGSGGILTKMIKLPFKIITLPFKRKSQSQMQTFGEGGSNSLPRSKNIKPYGLK